MKRIYVLIFLVFACAIVSNAQTWQKTDLGIKATIANLSIDIQFYSPSIVRIVKTPVNRNLIKESLSVIKKAQKTNVNIAKDGDYLKLKSETIQVQVNLGSGAISYYTKTGEALLKEKEGGAQLTPLD